MSLPAQNLEQAIRAAMLRDQHVFRKRLRRGGDPERLQKEIAASIAQADARRAGLPIPAFPDELPISGRREEIAAALAEHQVVVICGETGSGKSTQLPKICLALGRGVQGMIAHTQPRRLAARSIASRIAEELQVKAGGKVGYKIRFSDQTRPDTYIKVLTDGMLLAEIRSDRFLTQYDTIIIDEAHERSLNIDFLLGYLKQLLPQRPELKVIITSATIDPERFSKHFAGAPIISVSGRIYPVEVRYRPLLAEDEDGRDRGLQQAILDAVDEVIQLDRGDILVFLAGERDIRDTAEALRKHHPPHTEVVPLYARLSVAEQNRVFHPGPARRIVLATNVAETSLTVPRIKYVIDTGQARISRYSYRTKVQRLPIEPVSQASAEQRKGRCGRVGAGVCVRLYSEDEFLRRAEFTEPEILRTNLASVILQMQLLGLGAVEKFPFIEPPDPRYINDGYRLLQELQAVDDRRRITPLGRRIALLPLDPRLGRMLLAGEQRHCLREMLVVAAALSVQDPRERPHEAREAADAAHALWRDGQSDFMSLLNLWRTFHAQARHLSRNKLRAWCKEHFLSYVRMREWHDVHQQLAGLLKEAGARLNQQNAEYADIHCALLSGLLDRVGFKETTREYTGARNLKFHIFPGSGLFKSQPKWLVAGEIVETARTYARLTARIEPQWVEEAAAHLVQREYFEPHWQAHARRVGGYEKVTLYGLPLAAKRRINYGRVAPEQARTIFIREGLVSGDYPQPPAFLKENLRRIAAIQELEARSRRRDLLIDEEDLYCFYAERLPAAVHDGPSLESWLKKAGRGELQKLLSSDAVLLRREPDADTAERFPNVLLLNGYPLRLDYRFAPGEQLDGISIEVPLPLLGQLDAQRLEWLVPGLLQEKITALIRSLPKALRRNFVPAPDFARACADKLTFGTGGLLDALCAQLQRMTGIAIPVDAWQVDALPVHLRMNVRVLDESGTCLGEDEDLERLQARFARQAARVLRAAQVDDWPSRMTMEWDFGAIPDWLNLNGVRVYPALDDRDDAVELVLCASEPEARRRNRTGIRRLAMLALRDQVKYLRKELLGLQQMCLHYHDVDSCDALREDLITAVFVELLNNHAPASREDFITLCGNLREALIPAANSLAEVTGEILAHYRQTKKLLAACVSPAWLAAAQDIREQLAHLVYPGFVRRIPRGRLAHFPRYLQAVERRLKKLHDGNPRDTVVTDEIRRHWERALAQRDRWDDAPMSVYRWMVEEYRVSLFAQELGTGIPVSAQRLERQWELARKS